MAFSNHIAPWLGWLQDMERVMISERDIKLVVVALDKEEKVQVEQVVNRLDGVDVEVKIVPDVLDILSGSVKTSNLFSAVLTDIKSGF